MAQKQNELLEKLKNIELEIQEVDYIGEFETANNFKERLNQIKAIFFTDTGFFNADFSNEIDQQLESLKEDVSNFLIEKENEKKSNIENISTEELWNKLRDIADAHNKNGEYTTIEELEYSRDMANRVLKVIKTQVKRGEEININQAQQFCSIEDLLFVIKEELIKRAKKQEPEEQKSTLNMAKTLNTENINEVSLWQKLTDVADIKIYGSEDKKEIAIAKSQKSLLKLIKEKLGIRSKIKAPQTTVYTFGDINPATLEWENVTTIVDEFPRKFSRRQINRLLAIEINDVIKVTQEHELGKYPNLQKVTFGKGVKCIGKNVLSYIGNMDYIKELFDLSKLKEKISISYSYPRDGWACLHCTNEYKLTPEGWKTIQLEKNTEEEFLYHSKIKVINISDDVERIEEGAFSNLPELQEITFGNGIDVIPNFCCSNCMELRKLIFPNKIKTIGYHAFEQKCKEYIESLDIEVDTDDMEEINSALEDLRKDDIEKYNFINKYKEQIVIPSSIENIEYNAFEGFGVHTKTKLILTKKQQKEFQRYGDNIIIIDEKKTTNSSEGITQNNKEEQDDDFNR